MPPVNSTSLRGLASNFAAHCRKNYSLPIPLPCPGLLDPGQWVDGSDKPRKYSCVRFLRVPDLRCGWLYFFDELFVGWWPEERTSRSMDPRLRETDGYKQELPSFLSKNFAHRVAGSTSFQCQRSSNVPDASLMKSSESHEQFVPHDSSGCDVTYEMDNAGSWVSSLCITTTSMLCTPSTPYCLTSDVYSLSNRKISLIWGYKSI